MVLTDKVIKEEIYRGNIIIQGFKQENINPVSYDLTLAPTCKVYNAMALGIRPHRHPLLPDAIGHLHPMEKGSIEEWELDVRQKDRPVFEFEIGKDGFVLQPNHLYLYSCNETIGVKKDICATVMGKSSLGRLGLDIHVCAGFIDTGFTGSLVLEMRTIYPLRIYPGMKICQVKFERTEGIPEESYDAKVGSKYHGQRGVQESLYHKNFTPVPEARKLMAQVPDGWADHLMETTPLGARIQKENEEYLRRLGEKH
jgi:dCTP deaminase